MSTIEFTQDVKPTLAVSVLLHCKVWQYLFPRDNNMLQEHTSKQKSATVDGTQSNYVNYWDGKQQIHHAEFNRTYFFFVVVVVLYSKDNTAVLRKEH